MRAFMLPVLRMFAMLSMFVVSCLLLLRPPALVFRPRISERATMPLLMP